MYTANTMASAIEALGMSLSNSSAQEAVSGAKREDCARAGAAVVRLLEADIRPSHILTRKAFENAIAVVIALGGSTNAVLHLLAIAHAAGVRLALDDFTRLGRRVPVLADLKPSGRFLMSELIGIGGIGPLMRRLLEAGLLHGECLTVTGKTLAENIADAPALAPGQQVIHPIEQPVFPRGHLRILRGNLAPDGAVAKITGKEGERFAGPAKVFDSEEAMLAGLERGEIDKGAVVVIRYEGPKGGPGMPEMLTPTSAIMGAGLGSHVAMITDGRFSGGSHGFIIGHVTPEAQEGGPIALVQDGDRITIDASTCTLRVDLSDADLAARRAKWRPPATRVTEGVLAKYVRLVRSASEGCTTD